MNDGTRILLVEHDSSSALQRARHLETYGFSTRCESTVTAAIQAVSQALMRTPPGFDLLMVDDEPAVVHELDQLIRAFGGPVPVVLLWSERADAPLSRAPMALQAHLPKSAGAALTAATLRAVLDAWREVEQMQRREALLQYRASVHECISAIATSFANARSEEVDSRLHEALETVGRFWNVDRSYIFLIDAEHDSMDNTHEWCAPGIRPQKDQLQGLSCSIVPWWMKLLEAFQPINVPDVASMPEEAAQERRILEAQEIRSVAVVPLVWRHTLRGFIGFDAVRIARRWNEDDVRLLNALALVVAQALERSESEAVIAESEARFQRIAQHAKDVIFRIELIGRRRFSYINPAVTDITGYSPAEHLSDPDLWLRIVHPDDRSIVDAIPRPHTDWNEVVVLRWIRKDGSTVWTEQLHVPVYDKQGRLVAIEGIGRDITGRKNAENALAAALAEKELLLRELQHRVKNNLNVVRSILDIGKRRVQDRAALQTIADAQSRIQSMAGVYERLAGRLDAVDHLDVGAYLSELSRALFETYKHGGAPIALQVDTHAADLTVRRAVPLALILNELLTNILKHAFEPGRAGVVRVKLRSDPQRGVARLRVDDDGVGLPIGFDPDTTKSTGLSLVRTLAVQLDAELSFESIPGAGTVVTVDFPLRPAIKG